MGFSPSWIRADWDQHDDAWSCAALFYTSVVVDGRPGGPVFLDAIFREFSRDAGDQLVFAAVGVFEVDQHGVSVFRFGIGVPGAWTLVFLNGVRGDLWVRIRAGNSLDQPARDPFAVFERGGSGELAQFFVGARRCFEPVPGGFFPGAFEFAGAGSFAHCMLPCACRGAFRTEGGSGRLLGNPAEAIVCRMA